VNTAIAIQLEHRHFPDSEKTMRIDKVRMENISDSPFIRALYTHIRVCVCVCIAILKTEN